MDSKATAPDNMTPYMESRSQNETSQHYTYTTQDHPDIISEILGHVMPLDSWSTEWDLQHDVSDYQECRFVDSEPRPMEFAPSMALPTESTSPSLSSSPASWVATASTPTFANDDGLALVDPAILADNAFSAPIAFDSDPNQINNTSLEEFKASYHECIATTMGTTDQAHLMPTTAANQGDYSYTFSATYPVEFPVVPDTAAMDGDTNHSKPSLWECRVCKKKFAKRNDLTRHVKSIHETDGPKYWCICGKYERHRKDNYTRHVKSCKRGIEGLYYRCKCKGIHFDKAAHLGHVKLCTFGQGLPGRPV
ncbi:hypothetical protein GGS26DRAFT_488518 [Hypomontagnella submonticulosa]|nr:hypothetical protein GGS26DRAFT_488518 [Hypomontagnella submonticulosa]